jgi:hypothetical protein
MSRDIKQGLLILGLFNAVVASGALWLYVLLYALKAAGL